MSLYRNGLPQLSNGVFLTDGGLETDLIFHQGIELPHLAAYILLEDEANSSPKSHAELDDSPGLDEGNPAELGAHYRALLQRFPQIRVLGGCCGSDARHVRQIAEACAVH